MTRPGRTRPAVPTRVHEGGQRATVDTKATNEFTIEGRRIRETADQRFVIELREGEAKLVAIESQSTGISVDGTKVY